MKLKQMKCAAMLIALGLAAMCSLPTTWAQSAIRAPQTLSNAVVNYPLESDVSPPLSVMAAAPFSGTPGIAVIPRPLPTKPRSTAPAVSAANALPAAANPPSQIGATVGLDFEGVGNGATNNCPSIAGNTVAPPDTNAAVGDTQVVQWVNLCYAVFNKTTGALIAGPFKGNAFWAGMKSFCATSNAGDIIIQWDKANHVWVASQNVFRPYLTCVAISQTADATGAYNRYEFTQQGFPDYPKWGLTPNVYYQTQNDFGVSGSAFVGVNVCAYDAAAMRAASKKAKQVCILDNSNGTLFDDSMLPADNDYVAPATSTAPEVLVGSIDNPGFNSAVYIYTMTVNFKKGTATLTGANGSIPIPVPAFSLACGGGACIPQPSPGEVLDSLGDRLMYRLAHQSIGGNEYWLVTHSVNDKAAVGARWYQFTAPAGSAALVLAQSGQTPDDGHFRWMGSVAMDKFGDIALGYSRSSAAAGDYPSIYLSGQTAGEPAGTTDTESVIFAGSGSQISTGNRWGDYSSMALDGADLCSFWYTTEYYPANGSFAWQTRVAGQIKFTSCP